HTPFPYTTLFRSKGIAATSGEYVVISNPDAIPEPDCVRDLVAFADAHPRCGIAGPRMINPDGTLQASRRSFPTVGGTIVRRTPLRSFFPPLRWQRRHYLLDAPDDEPLQAMLRFLRKHPERLFALR